MQFSDRLLAQSGSTSRFSDVLSWVADNLHKHIKVEMLADLVGMSERHFARLFHETMG